MSTPEPGWQEVVRWMARNGGSAIGAARNFFPGLAPAQQEKLAAKYRNWWQRHKNDVLDEPASAPQGGQRQASAAVTVEPPIDLTKLSTVKRLEWQVGQQTVALTTALARGDLRAASQIDARLADLGKELDAARSRESQVLTLDRSAGAIAAALGPYVQAIALRAEMQRRIAERLARESGAEPAEPEEDP